ncbi:uncharacterized protein I303_105698 [Kwoniella dejecticola CBS 10117]|uniref:Hemerythrin-like domain-containing protein n=1 Tax=Kwoniella dejecticola CBS 10117 TaxID=1296121 RepID=A0A1A6A069_9TREE|nr:uncharacterized protein I303_05719 [Kwoniella dejecticola CBS 10117]OBR83441.1 hypothetical protein I303_05719 [Kwoniella dejecticola CBS 10117]
MTTISKILEEEHKDLEKYYHNIMDASSDDEQVRWQNQFTWELTRHSIGEELIVYPAFEKYLSEGKAMTDKDREEHQRAKELLYTFQGLKPDQPEFADTLQKIWEELLQHMKEEMREDMPTLEKALPDGESINLANEFLRTKNFVPTRSHPSAPDHPPFETVVGLLTAPIDKLGDLFRRFPKD